MCYNGIQKKKSWLTFAWFTCILCMLSFSLCYEYYKRGLIMLLWIIQESGQEAQSLFPPKQAEPFMAWGSCSSARLWRAHSSSSFPLHCFLCAATLWGVLKVLFPEQPHSTPKEAESAPRSGRCCTTVGRDKQQMQKKYYEVLLLSGYFSFWK